MEKGFLKYKKSNVHYYRFGQGDQLLIALHGFVDDGALFYELEESLKHKYIVYAIDLPYHGKTVWEKPLYDQSDFNAIFKMILEKEKKARFDLMGFSLGGRIALKMLLEWSSTIDTTFLIAPDGLKAKSDLTPFWLRSFLKSLLKYPGWLIALTKAMNKMKLLSYFHFKFVRHHISTKEKRDRLFNTWKAQYYFNPNIREMRSFLKSNPMRVELFFGRNDKIIPTSIGEALSKDLPNVHLNIVDSGHQLVNEKLNEQLKKVISR